MKYGKYDGYMGDTGIVINCPDCRKAIEIPDNHWDELVEKIVKEYDCPNCGKNINNDN